MREIRFRAWIGSVMVDPYCELEENYFIGEDEETLQQLLKSDGAVTVDAVMQYTGMNDSNGKRIFESDIMIGRHERTEYCIVEWNTRSWVLRNVLHDDPPETTAPTSFIEGEVVGNMYANPELLLRR